MLNKRQEKIILLLDDSKSWITGKEISRLMNVSDRTIRSDIDTINRYYDKPLIESNLRSGYRINQEVLVTLPIELNTVIPQTPEERCIYIIQELMFEKSEINLLDLQDQVFISGYSIDNDIKRIKKMLEPYDDIKLVRSRNYIHLEGSEQSKRQLYKELLSQETQGNFLNLNRLSSMFQDFDLLKVKKELEDVLDHYNYHVREMSMPMLMIHVGIAVERMLRYNYIETSRSVPELEEHKEYLIAKEFFKRLSKRIRIEVVDDEVKLLAMQLMGKKSVTLSNDLVNSYKKDLNVDTLVDEIIENIHNNFDIDFSKDTDLKNGLAVHLQGLIERRNKNINISENELGFLALHLGAAYERYNTNSKYRAVMIYPIDQALSDFCVKKIENLFSERMDIVACVSFFEEKSIQSIKPDIILTTLQLKHNLEIPTIQISLFLNNEDESKIFQALNILDKKRFRKEFEESLVKLIEKKNFYYDLDLQTPQEVITYMCDRLEEAGYCNEDFKNSVLQREKMAATSFVYSFAVPHSLNVASICPSISVAFLKKPIQWGDFEVKMVMLLATNEEQSNILKMFFSWLSNMINDANHFAALLETKSYEEFIAKIIE